jgi:hypothetical protein
MRADAFTVGDRSPLWCAKSPKKRLIRGATRHHRLSHLARHLGEQARRGDSCSPCTPCGHLRRFDVREDMERVSQRWCGIDRHKNVSGVCVITPTANGHRHTEIRPFRTVTGELLRLLDWLNAAAWTHVAMERTGVSWKPRETLLEGQVE